MFYTEILALLEKHKVQYVVVGGVAVVLHGVGRFTADLDLVVELSQDNLKKFLEAMKDAGYAPRLPVQPEELLSAEKREQWMKEKNLVVFSFWNKKNTLEEVDLLLEASAKSEIFARSQTGHFGPLVVRFASIEDLIEMKSNTGRKKDEGDIEDLNKVKKIQHEES